MKNKKISKWLSLPQRDDDKARKNGKDNIATQGPRIK